MGFDIWFTDRFFSQLTTSEGDKQEKVESAEDSQSLDDSSIVRGNGGNCVPVPLKRSNSQLQLTREKSLATEDKRVSGVFFVSFLGSN